MATDEQFFIKHSSHFNKVYSYLMTAKNLKADADKTQVETLIREGFSTLFFNIVDEDVTARDFAYGRFALTQLTMKLLNPNPYLKKVPVDRTVCIDASDPNVKDEIFGSFLVPLIALVKNATEGNLGLMYKYQCLI